MDNRIKVLRESRRLSVEELAKKIKVTPEELQKWEDGTEDISVEGCIALSKYFKAPVDFLVCLIPEKGDEADEQLYAYYCHPVLGKLYRDMAKEYAKIENEDKRDGFLDGWLCCARGMTRILKMKESKKSKGKS